MAEHRRRPLAPPPRSGVRAPWREEREEKSHHRHRRHERGSRPGGVWASPPRHRNGQYHGRRHANDAVTSEPADEYDDDDDDRRGEYGTGSRRERSQKRQRPWEGEGSANSSDDSSSSSSSDSYDWRKEVWRQGFQGMGWPAMAGGMTGSQMMQMGGMGQMGQMHQMGWHQMMPPPPPGGYPPWAADARSAAAYYGGCGGCGPMPGAAQGKIERPKKKRKPDSVGFPGLQSGAAAEATVEAAVEPKPEGLPPPEPPAAAVANNEKVAHLFRNLREEIVEVPRRLVAKVIGKGGVNLCDMRQKCGANIDARDQTKDPCNVRVLGTDVAIEKARDLIWDQLELAELKTGTVLEIPRVKIGKVLGIRGAQINAIQVQTGAKLDIERDGDPCRVTISGDAEKVEKAKKAILTLTMDAQADDGSEYLELPKAAIGAVLGVKGSRLREMMADSGARIDVDKTQPHCCRVRIAGSPDQIEDAKTRIIEAMKTPTRLSDLAQPPATHGAGPDAQTDMTEMVSETVDVPVALVGKVIGKSGSTIHALQAETGARIWVDPVTHQAQILGKPEAATLAKNSIMAMLEMFGGQEDWSSHIDSIADGASEYQPWDQDRSAENQRGYQTPSGRIVPPPPPKPPTPSSSVLPALTTPKSSALPPRPPSAWGAGGDWTEWSASNW